MLRMSELFIIGSIKKISKKWKYNFKMKTLHGYLMTHTYLRCLVKFHTIIPTMLIDLSKSELKKIEYYLLGDTDPLVVSILEKIRNLDNVCECGGKTNENSI